VASHEDHVLRARQLSDRGVVEKIASDAFDPLVLQLLAQALLRKAGDADHAALRRGALRHARERRAHLAADAENEDVADAREIGLELCRRPRHVLFELVDIGEAAHG
jgi:hypothetical protein